MTKPNNDHSQRLLTVAEVARILRTSTKTVRRRIASGALPHVREGRLLRVLADDLDRYLAANRHFSDVSGTMSH